MRLVALWVKRYMRINKQGFNLGSKYSYSFKFDPYKNSLTIKAKETEGYFPLFENQGVTNITGIIGINGAGKTTLLKLINVLASEQPLMEPVILVFENTEKNTVEIVEYEYYRGSSDLSIEFPKSGFISENKALNKTIEVTKTSKPFPNTDIVFYSSLYSEQNDKYLNLNDPLNRSVDYQTRISLSPERVEAQLIDYKRAVENKQMMAEEGFNVLKPYHDDKLKRLIKMLSDVNSKFQGIQEVITKVVFPKDITIWFNNNILKESEKLIERSLYNFEALAKLHSYCADINNKINNGKIKLRNEVIYKSFFIAFYNDYFNQSEKKIFLSKFEEYVKSIRLNSSVFNTLKDFLLNQNSPNKSFSISKINSLISNLDKLTENVMVGGHGTTLGLSSYSLAINDHSWEFLSQLLSVSDYCEENMFHYSLNPFSAGESALLGQFSELYESLNHISKDNIIVSIDEGELYLHPEWQRQYVNSVFQFFNYFNQALKLEKKIQIVLTSHSPFIASDIPKYNMIFLKRDSDGNCEVSNSEFHKPTFGGNIFELFNDSFFMKDFISDFAFNQMNEAFNFLKGSKSKFKTLQEVDSFTNLIGEPIIREELQKHVNRMKSERFDEFYEVISKIDTNLDNPTQQ